MVSWRNIRAVAFDLDGTLLDTLPDIADAGNAMLRDLGHDGVSEDVARGYIGDGVATLTHRLLTGDFSGHADAALFDRAMASFLRHYSEGVNRRTRSFPGVSEGLAQLVSQGYPLCVVTNKPERFVRPLLEGHRIAECFKVIVGGDSLPRKKPDPLPLQHCAEQCGVNISTLLLIGDSINDVKSARAAGCPVVCVPYGYTGGQDVRELGADAIVATVLEAAALIVNSQS